MIDVKQAVAAASKALGDFYGRQPDGLRLEEVEKAPGGWLITLGFSIEREPTQMERILGGPALAVAPTERVYKVFDVDGETGEVRSMKIRPT